MLDFILSKMNLLLLATAIFAIISFFTIGLLEKSTSSEASILLDRIVTKASSMANSSVYCDSFLFNLPSYFSVTGEPFYYVLKVSKSSRVVNGVTFNELIFAVVSRKDFKRKGINAPSIAAKSFLTKANLELYSFGDILNGQEPDFSVSPESVDTIFLDPQFSVPVNAVFFVKEVFNGKAFFHVIQTNTELADSSKLVVGKFFYSNFLNNGEERIFRC